jgi:hypothetical protein
VICDFAISSHEVIDKQRRHNSPTIPLKYRQRKNAAQLSDASVDSWSVF